MHRCPAVFSFYYIIFLLLKNCVRKGLFVEKICKNNFFEPQFLAIYAKMRYNRGILVENTPMAVLPVDK